MRNKEVWLIIKEWYFIMLPIVALIRFYGMGHCKKLTLYCASVRNLLGVGRIKNELGVL